MSEDTRQLKTYVWHGDKCFFVSTIERDSVREPPGRRYNETIVWEHDWDTSERGRTLYQEGSPRNQPEVHLEIVGQLYRTGKYLDHTDEDE